MATSQKRATQVTIIPTDFQNHFFHSRINWGRAFEKRKQSLLWEGTAKKVNQMSYKKQVKLNTKIIKNLDQLVGRLFSFSRSSFVGNFFEIDSSAPITRAQSNKRTVSSEICVTGSFLCLAPV